MFSIHNLSNNLASKIAIELNLDKDKKEVIAYGAFAFFQMIFSILLVIIFGWVFNVLIEALIISFTGSILRKSSGGAHASTPGICNAIGTLVCIGFGAFIKFLLIPKLNFTFVLLLGLLIFVWSFYMVYKLAPVDSLSKPIKKLEKRKRLKKNSMLILVAYLIIIVINLIFYNKVGLQNFLTYTLSMYIGIVWQVFTLTDSGHLLLDKIDVFLKHIFKV